MSDHKNRNLSDLSMLELFGLEAENQVAIITQGLLDLERNSSDPANLERLMRASHSLKGAARIVGLESVVQIAHLMEDCFVAAQCGRLTVSRQCVDVLLNATDMIIQIAGVAEPELTTYLSKNAEQLFAIEEQLKQATDVKTASELKLPFTNLTQVAYDPQVAFGAEDESDVLPDHSRAPFDYSQSSYSQLSTATRTRQTTDTIVRIDAERMTRLLGMSSELVVESRWLKPLADSFLQLKRRHAELATILENMRESLLDNRRLSDQDNLHFATAQKKLTECRHLLTENLKELDDYDRRNHKLSSSIYNEVIGTRMRPFVEATQGLQRMVRDISHALDKDATLEIIGQETPVDSDLVEKIATTLTHLVRNSLDHGVEAQAERALNGKDPTATIRLSAHHGGGLLTITVEDDGRGISLSDLRAKVVEKGLATSALVELMNDVELVEFLFLPYFSTRESVTEISGRGVGLDIVRNMMAESHGTIEIENNEGNGVKFILQLPVSLSVLTAIIVEIAGGYYAFPLSRIERLLSVDIESIKTIENRQCIEVSGRNVEIISAAQMLELNDGLLKDKLMHVVILSKASGMFGLVVDRFVGQRELSVQVLDRRLGKIQDISAAALMEDGAPVLIVDVDDMQRSADWLLHEGHMENLVLQKVALEDIKRKRILVVEDSLTVREVERKLLADQGYFVDVAVDGMDGWNAIRRTAYDLLITDVDMPRMDGIELVELMKQDQRLAQVPVMIVSYKDRHEDRRRGLLAGADYYLSKGSFHDETLIEAVIDLIGESSQ